MFSFTKILYTLINGYKILKKISYFKMDHVQLQTNMTDNVNECISQQCFAFSSIVSMTVKGWPFEYC